MSDSVYIIQPGDTLAEILARTGKSPSQLKALNSPNLLQKLPPGQAIYLDAATAFSFQAVFLDPLRHPIDKLRYRLRIGDKEFSGRTGANGLSQEVIGQSAGRNIHLEVCDPLGNWRSVMAARSSYGKRIITIVSPYLSFKDRLEPHPPEAPTTPQPSEALRARSPSGGQPPLPAKARGTPTPNNPAVKTAKKSGKKGESIIELSVDLPEDLLTLFQAYTGEALTDDDWKRTAEYLDCEINVIKAISQVESSGQSFWSLNAQKAHVPAILYERHYFSRLTDHRYDRDYPDVSGKARTSGTYGDHGSQYLRLINAYRLDSGAALKSCSWGKFQIMGENCSVCGVPNIDDFVEQMCTNEAKQLQLLADFIRNKKNRLNKKSPWATLLWNAVKDKDWPNIANYYNGPNYAQYEYDKKLENAYLKIKGEQK